jgi:hypothetical protein
LKKKLPTALIFVGGAIYEHEVEDKYWSNCRFLEHYLKAHAGVERVSILNSAVLSASDVTDLIDARVRDSSALLVAFNGHANTKGWRINRENRVMYSALTDIIKAGNSPTLVVSDCCRAMSLASICKARGVSGQQVGIIAASSAYGFSSNMANPLIPGVVGCWTKGEDYPNLRLAYRKARGTDPRDEKLLLRAGTKRILAYCCPAIVRWGARHDHLFFRRNGKD